MENLKVRLAAMEHDVTISQMAEHLGILRTSLSRKLRKELRERQQADLLRAISEIAASRGTEEGSTT